MRKSSSYVSVVLVLTMLMSVVCFPAPAVAAKANPTNDMLIELEDAKLDNLATEVKDKMASGGKYVIVPCTIGMCNDPDEYKKPDIMFNVDITEDATYKVYLRVNIPDGTKDSYHYKWDDGEWSTKHPGPTWDFEWINVASTHLTKGTHTFSFTHREPNAMYDAMYITTDDDSLPTWEDLAVATPTPQPPKKPKEIFKMGATGVEIEAEDGTIDDGKYKVEAGQDTSGGEYIISTQAFDKAPGVGRNADIEFTFTTERAGTYSIWIREIAPAVGNESMFWGLDDKELGAIWVPVTSEWLWTKLGAEILEPGEHKIKFSPRKINMKIDKLIITDQIFTPSGEGELPKSMTEVEMGTLPEGLYPKPPANPPSEHPRLMFRASDIDRLKTNIEGGNSYTVSAAEAFKKNIAKTTDGVLRPGSNGKITIDTNIMDTLVAHALNYAVYGDETSGQMAVDGMENFLRSAAAATGFDGTRTGGSVIRSASQVYDWCYDLLTEAQKKFYIMSCETLAGGMEVSWPPVLQGDVVGHGVEAQIQEDLLSFAIAVYDERPDVWDTVAGRVYNYMAPAADFVNQAAGWHHQGDSYGEYRHHYNSWAQFLITAMGLEAPMNNENLTDMFYGYLYARRPDGQFMRDGDTYEDSGETMGSYWAAGSGDIYYLDGYLGDDPYLIDEANRRNTFGTSATSLYQLIYSKPELKARSIYELPKSMFTNDPMAVAFARTGWEDGVDSDAVVAMMKVGGYHFGNHQDFDDGHFQIYYKGALASDSGIYQGKQQSQGAVGSTRYGEPHHFGWQRKSIAHNTVLVFDPTEKFSDGYNDGGQSPKNGNGEPKNLEVLEEWNKDNHAQTVARELGPDTHEPAYTYIKGDLTNSYSDKVKEFNRSFMFLNLFDEEVPAALIVFDKVVSSNASFKKTWLLHGLEEPEINGNQIIYRRTYSDSRGAMTYNGKLICDTLMPAPENTAYETVGGEGKEFFYHGTNYAGYPGDTVVDEGVAWRVEVSPKAAAETDYFLNVLQVSDNDKEYYREVAKIDTNEVAGAVIADRVVTFSKSGKNIESAFGFSVSGEGEYQYTLADMKPGKWSVNAGGVSLEAVATEEGQLVSFTAPAGDVSLSYIGEGGEKEFINTPNPELDVVSVRFDKKFVYSDVPATIIDGRTLVPMRAIFETFGAELAWDANTATATATLSEKTVQVTENNTTAYVDGNAVTLDVPAMILDGRFVVPVRFISESFGADVLWDANAKTVYITPDQKTMAYIAEQEGYAKIKSVSSSEYSEDNYDHLVLDLDLKTLWSAEGEEYIDFEFKEESTITAYEIILNPNNGRSAEMEIFYSNDGTNWTSIKKYFGNPAADGENWEVFTFPTPVKAKYMRYLAKGSDKSMWNGVKEIRFKLQ